MAPRQSKTAKIHENDIARGIAPSNPLKIEDSVIVGSLRKDPTGRKRLVYASLARSGEIRRYFGHIDDNGNRLAWEEDPAYAANPTRSSIIDIQDIDFYPDSRPDRFASIAEEKLQIYRRLQITAGYPLPFDSEELMLSAQRQPRKVKDKGTGQQGSDRTSVPRASPISPRIKSETGEAVQEDTKQLLGKGIVVISDDEEEAADIIDEGRFTVDENRFNIDASRFNFGFPSTASSASRSIGRPFMAESPLKPSTSSARRAIGQSFTAESSFKPSPASSYKPFTAGLPSAVSQSPDITDIADIAESPYKSSGGAIGQPSIAKSSFKPSTVSRLIDATEPPHKRQRQLIPSGLQGTAVPSLQVENQILKEQVLRYKEDGDVFLAIANDMLGTDQKTGEMFRLGYAFDRAVQTRLDHHDDVFLSIRQGERIIKDGIDGKDAR
ncbi:MAG: hypothetical protein M1819_001365 [Sarea resinae]|nr:MAG: hypothetical protein M1819_001365 [Sarea resinae]